MSQLIHVEQDQLPEPDPLLAFVAEPGCEPAAEPPASSDDPVDPAANPTKPAAAALEPVGADEDIELRRRVERTERLLEKSLIEVAALKSDLATLVITVDDIRKRQSRRAHWPPMPPQPKLPARLPHAAMAAGAALLIVFGFAAWAILAMGFPNSSQTPPVKTGSIAPLERAAPVEASAVPAVDLQKATAAPAVVAARDVAAREGARQGERLPRAPASGARTATTYVGTLTIDSSPPGDVFVNRKNIGRAPVRIENLRAGSHLVWIERDGYRRFTRVVAVAADRVSRVSADLDPIVR